MTADQAGFCLSALGMLYHQARLSWRSGRALYPFLAYAHAHDLVSEQEEFEAHHARGCR